MKNLSWKTLSSEQLFSDTWFKVRKETCEKPDGTIVAPYYVYEFPTWVAALAFTHDNRVIIERQYRHAIGETHYEIPGGCVDNSDTNLKAAIGRELLEETGYQFTHYDYIGKISPNASTNSNWLHIFIAHGGTLVQAQNLDVGEEIEVYTVSIEELIVMLRRGDFVQALHTAALYKSLDKLGRIKLL